MELYMRTGSLERAREKRRSCSRRSLIKLESLETLQLNSTGTFSRSVTARRYSMVTPKELDRTCARAIFWEIFFRDPRGISQMTIDFYESKLKGSVKRKPNSRYYDMQIIIRSSLIAKNASGISGSIVSLPLRSARLNRPSDVENRFIVTWDYCPLGSCG